MPPSALLSLPLPSPPFLSLLLPSSVSPSAEELKKKMKRVFFVCRKFVISSFSYIKRMQLNGCVNIDKVEAFDESITVGWNGRSHSTKDLYDVAANVFHSSLNLPTSLPSTPPSTGPFIIHFKLIDST